MVFCAIWNHFYSLKNVKNTHRGVLLLVTKSNTPPWVFSRFLNCTNSRKSHNASHMLWHSYCIRYNLCIKLDNWAALTANRKTYHVTKRLSSYLIHLMLVSYPFKSSEKPTRGNENSLQCNLYETWIHLKCNDLNFIDYEKLQNQTEPQYCFCFNCTIFPFGKLNNQQFNKFLLYENDMKKALKKTLAP